MHHNGGFERALIPHQIETVRGDMEKLKARVKGERREREALSELTGVHSDVFVDVQKKLESHTQRLKTHEVQMAEHVDETSERIIAFDVGLAALTRESKRVRTFFFFFFFSKTGFFFQDVAGEWMAKRARGAPESLRDRLHPEKSHFLRPIAPPRLSHL
jgi:LmbE family N-acetylglucosaminyl deacetylase